MLLVISGKQKEIFLTASSSFSFWVVLTFFQEYLLYYVILISVAVLNDEQDGPDSAGDSEKVVPEDDMCDMPTERQPQPHGQEMPNQSCHHKSNFDSSMRVRPTIDSERAIDEAESEGGINGAESKGIDNDSGDVEDVEGGDVEGVGEGVDVNGEVGCSCNGMWLDVVAGIATTSGPVVGHFALD